MTPLIDPSATICDSMRISFKPPSPNRLPRIDNMLQIEYCMGETIDGELLQTSKNNSIAIQTDDTGCSNGCTSMYAENGSILQQSNLEREIPGGSEESNEYCMGETIDGELLQTSKNNSIAIQTDDTGCSNGCTSMYAENGSILQQSNLEREIPGGSEESNEYCMGETIDGELLQTSKNNSIAIQTDDTGCSNGCTSMYAENGSILQQSNLEREIPGGSEESNEYCMGETIDGELLQTSKNNSIAIQTDDTGCSNGCTSMYAENGSILQQSNLEREIPGGSEESNVSGDTNVFMDDVDVDDNEVTARRVSSGSNEKESTSGSIENTETEIKVEINCTDEDIPGGSEDSNISGDTNVFMDDVDVDDNEVTARRVSSGSNEKESISGSIENTETEIKVEINCTDEDIPGGSEESNVFMDDVDVDDNEVTAQRVSSGSNETDSTSGSIDNTETEIEANINCTDEDRTDQTNAICKPSKYNLRILSGVSHPLPDETFEVPMHVKK
ncbi:hypothetical protein QZH41_004798 [Actinostola sp. cb2023]|nr:hypothetical protein QZH41_004798 [Actinostola sp. cb2023]